ncbi:hypothetical protein MRX96_015728 [Rhipicephalus microplus]
MGRIPPDKAGSIDLTRIPSGSFPSTSISSRNKRTYTTSSSSRERLFSPKETDSLPWPATKDSPPNPLQLSCLSSLFYSPPSLGFSLSPENAREREAPAPLS